jgi:hypothetical protein
MIAAIQVHPHDIRDEGAVAAVSNIARCGKIRIICPEVSALDERHPYPSGDLPHNPARKSLISKATLEVPLDFGASLPFYPILSPEAANGEDYVEDLLCAASCEGCEVVPWIKGLNAAFGGNFEPFRVRSVDGSAARTWLCPSRDEAKEYVVSLIKKVSERYGTKTVLLDRMRYPDWSGGEVRPERMFGCFCSECRRKMSEEGIDTKVLERLLRKFTAGRAPGEFPRIGPEPREAEVIKAWLMFRMSRITDLVRAVRNEAPVKLWLNLWPPSFAPFMGQDYASLGRLCDGAKHFPYHKLGGGADLKGLIDCLSPNGEDRERLFSHLLRFLELPYKVTFEEFSRDGFPKDFVGSETAKAKKAFGDTPIFSGIQIWDVGENDIEPACASAAAGGADGFFFYCYGWASLDALRESGRVAEKFGHAISRQPLFS